MGCPGWLLDSPRLNALKTPLPIMANNKQAKKRNRQRDKRHLHNRLVLGSMRTALRKARAAFEDESSTNAKELVRTAIQAIDRAVSKSAIKRRTGSRLISRLARRAA